MIMTILCYRSFFYIVKNEIKQNDRYQAVKKIAKFRFIQQVKYLLLNILVLYFLIQHSKHWRNSIRIDFLDYKYVRRFHTAENNY